MIEAGELARAIECYGRRAWGEAYARLSAADREHALDPGNLERLATAAWLVGRDAESTEAWARAHHEYLVRGAATGAARCAFWLGYGLFDRGEAARGSGWMSRAQRLLCECGDCVERGYLLLPTAIDALGQGDGTRAHGIFGEAAAIGERFGDASLTALARHGQGRALIRLGRSAEGVALLDEAMVAVTVGEVLPIAAGDVYCGVLSACHEIFDLRRAQEWTTALTEWCASQPDLVPYRGQCLIRRAELLQLRGAWPEAMDEARRACERLSHPPGQPGLGAALYQHAELLRARGELAAAEEMYRQVGAAGRSPEPGLALLRLARGEVDAAAAAIRRALNESGERRSRSRLLGAFVEIMLSAGEVPAARAAAEELAEIAASLRSPFLLAVAGCALGAVRLAEGDAIGALPVLRRAWTAWQEIEAPCEAARARVLAALACRALGDEHGAVIELEAAAAVFRELGAQPDLARVGKLAARDARRPAEPLSPRQVEVLKLLATGMTNRAIAAELAISEKTVARHVSNLFTKLDLSSRAAATAYAFRHGLA